MQNHRIWPGPFSAETQPIFSHNGGSASVLLVTQCYHDSGSAKRYCQLGQPDPASSAPGGTALNAAEECTVHGESRTIQSPGLIIGL